MENDRTVDAETDGACPSANELRERAAIIARSSAAPHVDTASGGPLLAVIGAGLMTLTAWSLLQIVQHDAMWLLWAFLILPLAGHGLWAVTATVLRRRHGVAPARTGQPRELRDADTRAMLWSLTLEVAVFAAIAFLPAPVALPAVFAASFLFFLWAGRAFVRAAARVSERLG